MIWEQEIGFPSPQYFCPFQQKEAQIGFSSPLSTIHQKKWSEEDDFILSNQIRIYGFQRTNIAKKSSGRSVSSIKNRYKVLGLTN